MINHPNQKTFKAYLIGLVLCLIFTISAFMLIEHRSLLEILVGIPITDAFLYVALSVLAIGQLLVQSVCFLNLNTSPEGKWNLMPFLFTLLVIVILVSGSLWIMYNLNANM